MVARRRPGGAEEGEVRRRALGALARRPLTRREMGDRLARDGFGAGEVEAALEALASEGFLDDGKLASHFVVSRANRRRLGRSRLIADLRARGVSETDARRAWEEAVADGLVAPAEILERSLDRRLGEGALDSRRVRRVYNALLRAGFEPAAIRAALDARRPGLGSLAEGNSERTHDDVP